MTPPFSGSFPWEGKKKRECTCTHIYVHTCTHTHTHLLGIYNSFRFIKRPMEWRLCIHLWASLVAQRLKRLPAMRETWVRSLGREDPLEKEMATHSSTRAWRIPWRRSLVGYSPRGGKELDTTEQLHFHFHGL